MQITLNRRLSENGATIGDLSVARNGATLFSCFTCEDRLREIPGNPVAEWKVPGKTAIPAGDYRLIVTLSQRFKCALPLVLEVAGFVGIRIHRGNTAEDTEGCLLPGLAVAPDGHSVLRSREAFDALFTHILDALNTGEACRITINNPPNYPARASG